MPRDAAVSEVPIRVLGPVRLRAAMTDASTGGRVTTRLLVALVAHGPHPVRLEALAETAWPSGRPDDPVPPLRMAVSRLRNRLADRCGLEAAIRGVDGAYQLAVGVDDVDAWRFEALVGEAQRLAPVDPRRASHRFEGALALWSGEPFGDLGEEPWAIGHVSRLRELRLAAEEELAELDLALGREATAVLRLRRGVEAEPFRERRWALLAIALYRTGRQTDALRSLAEARRRLRDQIGVEPGAELQAVERAILAHEPVDLDGPERRVTAPPSVRRELVVGRDHDEAEVLRLLAMTRVVTIHGLGGVGKSTLADLVTDHLARRGCPCVKVSIDGLSDPREVALALADGLGTPGAIELDDLVSALALQFARGRRVVLIDGAEAAAATVAVVAEAIVAGVEDVQVLITARAPVGASGEVGFLLVPLPVGELSAPGPAVELFLRRSAVGTDPRQLGRVLRECENAGGLPLAIEVAAAGVDLVHDVASGPAAEAEPGRTVASVIDGSVAWAMGFLGAESREALATVSALVDGAALPALRLATTAPGDDRRALVPLLQTGLARSAGHRAGVLRYQALSPVREAAARLLVPEEVERGRRRALAHLTEVAAAVGGPVEMRRAEALAPAEAELGNARHWLTHSIGSEAGLALASVVAPVLEDVGAGDEAAWWMDLHLPGSAPSLVWARAVLVSAGVRGFFSGVHHQVDELEIAATIADDHEDWRLWLALQARIALAACWSGDLAGAHEILDGRTARDRLTAVDDPWLDGQRWLVDAIVQTWSGDALSARQSLGSVVAVSRRLGDIGTATSALFLFAFIARMTGDDQGSVAALTEAREFSFSGVARGTQALIAAELAHHARQAGDGGAVAMMTEAVEALERAGNRRSAAVRRRDVGTWRLVDGDAGGRDDLQASVPALLRADRLAAAPALAALARLVPAGEGAVLARAAKHLLDTAAGTPASEHDRQLVLDTARDLVGDVVAAPTDEAIVALLHDLAPV